MRNTNQVLMEWTFFQTRLERWTPREIANTHYTRYCIKTNENAKRQKQKTISSIFKKNAVLIEVTCSPTCTKAIFLLFFFLVFFISWKASTVEDAFTKCSYNGFSKVSGADRGACNVYTISWYTDSFSSQRQNTLHLLVSVCVFAPV